MARYDAVESPVPFPEAFREGGDSAAQTQAAVLLLMGALLRSEELRSQEALSIAMSPAPETVEVLPEHARLYCQPVQ